MPWYTTLYNADSSPIDAERLRKDADENAGYHIGRYGNRIYAGGNFEHRETIDAAFGKSGRGLRGGNQ